MFVVHAGRYNRFPCSIRSQEFVQTFGVGKPRLCEYIGQMFCSSCHTNDTAVLPARVLHYWDFTQYPVSQLAKLYLDSIIDQPMLCVTAVNPFLISKVKVLLHVVSTKTKIRALLEYVHCPFRGSIDRGLGSRRYLFESTDFFSLRNLIDLSRGAFSDTETAKASRKQLKRTIHANLFAMNVPVVCAINQVVLSLYAARRASGILVNIGFRQTSVVPIMQGKIMRKVGVQSIGIGGLKLTEFLREQIQTNNIYCNSPTAVRELKENLCYVAYDYEMERSKVTSASYEVLGDRSFTLSEERYKTGEILFRPKLAGM